MGRLSQQPEPLGPGFELTPMGQLMLAATPLPPTTRTEIAFALSEAFLAETEEACPTAIRNGSPFYRMAMLVERWLEAARADAAVDVAGDAEGDKAP